MDNPSGCPRAQPQAVGCTQAPQGPTTFGKRQARNSKALQHAQAPHPKPSRQRRCSTRPNRPLPYNPPRATQHPTEIGHVPEITGHVRRNTHVRRSILPGRRVSMHQCPVALYTPHKTRRKSLTSRRPSFQAILAPPALDHVQWWRRRHLWRPAPGLPLCDPWSATFPPLAGSLPSRPGQLQKALQGVAADRCSALPQVVPCWSSWALSQRPVAFTSCNEGDGRDPVFRPGACNNCAPAPSAKAALSSSRISPPQVTSKAKISGDSASSDSWLPARRSI